MAGLRFDRFDILRAIMLCQRYTRAMQRAVYRRHTKIEELCDLVSAHIEHIAQNQNGALTRRQNLERGEKRERDAFARIVPRFGTRFNIGEELIGDRF